MVIVSKRFIFLLLFIDTIMAINKITPPMSEIIKIGDDNIKFAITSNICQIE